MAVSAFKVRPEGTLTVAEVVARLRGVGRWVTASVLLSWIHEGRVRTLHRPHRRRTYFVPVDEVERLCAGGYGRAAGESFHRAPPVCGAVSEAWSPVPVV